jgi:hypothetical protein
MSSSADNKMGVFSVYLPKSDVALLRQKARVLAAVKGETYLWTDHLRALIKRDVADAMGTAAH